MAFCNQCGAQLKEGAKFCGQCGTRVRAAHAVSTEQPQYQVVAPAINPPQAVQSSQIIKQGALLYTGGAIKKEKGTLTLYLDRLEWKGEKGNSALINLSEISAFEIKILLEKFIITLSNAQNHTFIKPLSAGRLAQGLAFGGIVSTVTLKKEFEEWQTAINKLRGN
jgi:hypothetical protein